MAVEGIAPALSSSAQSTGSGQSTGQERISELNRMEQDVRKMKSDYRSRAKSSGMTQSEIEIKIKEYDRLIAKIEQEIRQIKRSEAKKSSGQKKVSGSEHRTSGSGSVLHTDSTAVSVAALKASYRALVQPSAVLAPPQEAERIEAEVRSLDELV